MKKQDKLEKIVKSEKQKTSKAGNTETLGIPGTQDENRTPRKTGGRQTEPNKQKNQKKTKKKTMETRMV